MTVGAVQLRDLMWRKKGGELTRYIYGEAASTAGERRH